MSISTNFPTIKPSLLLDFANVGALDPRITFTRSTTATYYDGVTTAKAEENLLTYSQEFDNAAWTKSNVAISGTNTVVAPDGTTTAEEVRDGAATAGHSLFQAYTVAAGTTYVLSCFLKNVDRQFAILAVSTGSGTWASAKFDLSAGTAGSTSAAGTGWSATSSSITSVGSGWYRCVLVFVAGNSASANARIGTATDGTTFTGGGSGLESYTGTDLKIASWGAQLEQRSAVTAYTATTTQPITNYIPVLQTAAANVARFDHTPTTGEALGLLVEEQRTNLLTYSAEFDNAAWTKTASSITANAIASPDGALTADKLVEDTAASSHGVSAATAPTTTISTNYSISIFAKKAERNFLQIFFTGGHVTGNPRANYDLNTGTLGSVDSGITATITAVGNGWYRCVASVVAATTALRPFFNTVTSSSAARNESYTGNGYDGIFIWGAQLEAGAFPTSYTATTSAQVTRSADAASMTGTNFSSWYNAGEGTLYAESQLAIQSTTTRTVAIISDGTSNNFIDIRYRTTGISGEVITQNSVTQVNLSASVSAITANQSLKDAFAFDFNNAAASANNQSASTDTSCVIPLVNEIDFGAVNATNYLNGHIRKLAFYPQRLTNAQLQALTS